MKLNRYSIMQIHMLVAGFILPLALAFFVGGALYTANIKGEVDKQEIELTLEQPFKPDMALLTVIVERELGQRDMVLPDDEPTLKRQKSGVYKLRWNTLSESVTFEGRPKAMQATLTIRERGLLTQIMRIHRAEAGRAFKVLSLLLAGGLLLIFASGLYLALMMPKMRKPLLASFTAGVAAISLALLL